MQCERLIKLAKSWYIHVRNETMAPARMVSFIKQHVAQCDICLADPEINAEIEKITELILPESKIPKAVRLAQEKEAEAEAEAEEDAEVYDDDEDSVDAAEDTEGVEDDTEEGEDFDNTLEDI